MEYLNKDQIMSADDLQEREVAVPEWGGTVLIKALTGHERDNFEASVIVGRGRDRDINMRALRAKLSALSIIDPVSKERMFSEKEVRFLGQKSARALQRVFEAAQELNGMTDEAVEELVGNSDDAPLDDSGTDWPSPSEDVPSRSSSGA